MCDDDDDDDKSEDCFNNSYNEYISTDVHRSSCVIDSGACIPCTAAIRADPAVKGRQHRTPHPALRSDL